MKPIAKTYGRRKNTGPRIVSPDSDSDNVEPTPAKKPANMHKKNEKSFNLQEQKSTKSKVTQRKVEPQGYNSNGLQYSLPRNAFIDDLPSEPAKSNQTPIGERAAKKRRLSRETESTESTSLKSKTGENDLTKPKDLSGIFMQFIPPSSPSQASLTPPRSKSPILIASSLGLKRSNSKSPLARSLSEDLGTPKTPKPLTPTRSLPQVFSAQKPSLSRVNSASQASRSTNEPSKTISMKRTYGGPRTIRAEQPESEDSSNAGISSKLGLPTYRKERDSYASLRKKWGLDEENNGIEDSTHDLKSVTELREKGENKRFKDELEWHLEGLLDEEIAVKRSSVVEITRKMIHGEFVRKLKSSGLVERAYIGFRDAGAGNGDQILDLSFLFFVTYLLRDSSLGEILTGIPPRNKIENGGRLVVDEKHTGECDLIQILLGIFKRPWADDVIPNSKGSSKNEKLLIMSISKLIEDSGMFQEEPLPVTARSLSLYSLFLISSLAPRGAFAPQELITSTGALDLLSGLLISNARLLHDRLYSYERGLDLLPAEHQGWFHLTELVLRIIEICVDTTTTAQDVLVSHQEKLAPALSTLVLYSSMLLSTTLELETKAKSSAIDAIVVSLKILIERTTHDPECARLLSTQDGLLLALVKILVISRRKSTHESRFAPISSTDAPSPVSLEVKNAPKPLNVVQEAQFLLIKFDMLCLALGVLTNMVECVPNIQRQLGAIELSKECTNRRGCVFRCSCLKRVSCIEPLIDLYLDKLEDSTNPVNTEFIHGYSGMLVGLTMLDCPDNQEIVTNALENYPTALNELLDTLEQFASLHQAADKLEDGDTEPENESEDPDAIAAPRPNGPRISAGLHRVVATIRGISFN